MKLFSKAIDTGLSCIPVYAQTGAAFFDGWEKYSKRLPTEKEADEWDRLYPIGEKYGIALVLGEASGLICSDIDTDEKEIHDIVPRSPYGKRGLPGRATYFYKYNKDFFNISESKSKVGLFVTNKYTIIPPSKHRKFDGTYEWLGDSIFDIDRDEVPGLKDLTWHSRLPKSSIEEDSKEGRNNHLKRIVQAMRYDGKSENEIVKFVYEWDMRHHSPRLFIDPEEQWKAKSETEAILCSHRFVLNVTQSLLRSGVKLELPFQKKPIEISTEVDKFKPRPVPVPKSGFLKEFVAVANSSTPFLITPLAVGGALSFLSILCANRITLNDTWPNIYVLGLAQSGLGKGSVVSLLKSLLMGTNLQGADMYRSGQSYVSMLSEQQERLDVIDEAGAFFEAMKSSLNYSSDLPDVLNRLFSGSHTYFGGISSVKHGKNSGACYNPCVSIYATVHQAGFLRSVQGYLGQSGLMPRFLVFEQSEFIKNDALLPLNERRKRIEPLKEFLRTFFSVYPKIYDDKYMLDASKPQGKPVIPHEMALTEGARELLDNYYESTNDALLVSKDSQDAPYIARMGEYVTKISLLSAVSNCNATVEKEDVAYAIELMEVCNYNAQLIRQEISSSGRVTGPIAKVKSFLRRKGKTSRAELLRAVDLRANELDALLKPFIEEDEICCAKETAKTKEKTYYWLPSSH